MKRKILLTLIGATVLMTGAGCAWLAGKYVFNRLRAELGAVRSEIQVLRADTDRLRADVLDGLVAALNRRAELASVEPPGGPSPAQFDGVGRIVMAMLDDVPLHQKNGRVEIYGASLRQRNAGPIGISRSVAAMTAPDAWLVWVPDATAAGDATQLRVSFAVPPVAGRLQVVLRLRDLGPVAFEARLGPDAPAPAAGILPPLYPEEWASLLRSGVPVAQLERTAAGEFVAALPNAVMAKLRDGRGDGIQEWFVRILGANGTTLEFDRIALLAPLQQKFGGTATIAGTLAGEAFDPRQWIEVLLEDGTIVQAQPSTDGRFTVPDLPLGSKVSLRYRHKNQDRFANLGRWFSISGHRDDIVVNLNPRFKNPEGRAPDPAQAKFVTPRVPSDVAALYEPHVRQVWPGAGRVQEYDPIRFTNNFGFLDRDRFFDNPDKCYRIVHLGSSHAVALQVPNFEKYNILMEAELSVRFKGCVEVISAGRDNGDMASNFPRLRDYARKFSPDLVLLENSTTLVKQMHPRLLRDGFGWDADHNALDGFLYGPDGRLVFKAWDPNYALHSSTPSYPELIPGVPFFSTLKVEESRLPTVAKEALKKFGDVVVTMREAVPGVRLVVHNGLDQAQCRNNCVQTVNGPGGEAIAVSVRNFLDHHARICRDAGIECVELPIPQNGGDPDEFLTFVHDGHYSPRGHQWLARHLADAVTLLPAR